MQAMNLDLDLINERNARLVHEMRAERFRRRSRTDRGPHSGARRIAKLFRQPQVVGQETTAEEV